MLSRLASYRAIAIGRRPDLVDPDNIAAGIELRTPEIVKRAAPRVGDEREVFAPVSRVSSSISATNVPDASVARMTTSTPSIDGDGGALALAKLDLMHRAAARRGRSTPRGA